MVDDDSVFCDRNWIFFSKKGEKADSDLQMDSTKFGHYPHLRASLAGCKADFFASFGYGPLDDFHFGAKPPIYYLTGFQGTLRWQGLFA